MDEQEARLLDAEVKNKSLGDEIQRLTSVVTDQSTTINNLRLSMADLDQYSRRNYLQVFGIEEQDNESTDDVICQLARDSLGVIISKDDIDRSHRVGDPRKQPRRKNGKPGVRPIVVKFTSYRTRHTIISRRRRLKGTNIVIQEQLTKANLQLLKNAKKMKNVINAWSSDGRVIVKLQASNDSGNAEQGRTFVFAIPQFYNNPEGLVATLTVIGTSRNATQVKVNIREIDFAESRVVSYHQASMIALPRSVVADVRNSHAMTVTVSSSNDISVRCRVEYEFDLNHPGEGFLVLPVASLNTEYFIVTAATPEENLAQYKGKPNHSLFTISAAYHDTIIHIETVAPLNVSHQFFPSKKHINLSLNKHKSILISSSENLSRTRVTASKPIAVVSGNDCGIIPGIKSHPTSCYFMVEQLLPTSFWGVEFEVSPFQFETSHHVLYFAVLGEDTEVTINDDVKRVLSPDKNMGFIQRLSGSHVTHVSSNFPIMIVHFIQKTVSLGVSGAMTIVPSAQEFVRRAYVAVPAPRRFQDRNVDFSVCIVTNCSLMNNIRVNGNPLNPQSQPVRLLRGHFCSIDLRIYTGAGKIVTISSSSEMARMLVTAKRHECGLLDFAYPVSLGLGMNGLAGNSSSCSDDVAEETPEIHLTEDEDKMFRFIWYACIGGAGLICLVAVIISASRKSSSRIHCDVKCCVRRSQTTSSTDYDDFSLDQLSFHRCPSSMCSSNGITSMSHSYEYQLTPYSNSTSHQISTVPECRVDVAAEGSYATIGH
ncbi:uncharacterized protein LOC121415407 [Lytechinus variegatus]|uniref:uncharacterized protein LOC121415407 n=1 Tax=Lytechinus variegatus TaxID=7654 RepID=UPI001BB12264|nr:uncharacterized protein LOC121415407 [Lytechinus variegatus]